MSSVGTRRLCCDHTRAESMGRASTQPISSSVGRF
jgi:hypothetical protein